MSCACYRAPAEANLTTVTTATLPDSDSYLFYAPTTSLKFPSKNHYFEKLGFTSEEESKDMRHAFIANMDYHVQHRYHKFLNRNGNPEAFSIVVAEFLARYGPIYWGNSKRSHLEEPDVLEGFLCPRDATRANSRLVYTMLFLIALTFIVDRLVAVLESFFNYRANNARTADVSYSRFDCLREY